MKEIKEKYDFVGPCKGKHSINGFGEIDFDSLTLPDVDLLYKAGCPAFKLKQTKPQKST